MDAADAAMFAEKLAAYKKDIDEDIVAYAKYALETAGAQFGPYGKLEVETFLDILSRGGKRIRGALIMHAYAMLGGTNKAMILQAARAIEMVHAYMLILDDIQDRSTLRRGKPTAQVMLADYHHKHHLKGDPDHAGIALGINVGIAGNHAAQIILANMDADPQLKLNVLSITNRTLMITAHGQMYDVMNEMLEHPDPADIERVMEWKTALYSFINPLHVGMVLAGAGCEDTDAITPFARHTGKAFQVADDILGVYGDEAKLGKSAMDDIREGKITTLTQYALNHATPEDQAVLRTLLGKADLTDAEFQQAKNILERSGARDAATRRANKEIEEALASLDSVAHRWPAEYVDFLRALARKMVARNS
jgi:geranylgeranyl pyrophosphate synthase